MVLAHVLGVDGGGSHTRAQVCDTNGRIIGVGRSGPSNPLSCSQETCRASLEEAIQQALSTSIPQPLCAAHLGIAGAGNPKTRAHLIAIASEIFDPTATKIDISHDLEIALEGGLLGKPGVALVAGTGSACYARDAGGSSALTGGWGEWIDDAGGGSWIGLKALQACVRQEDGRAAASKLKNSVMEYLRINTMDAFKERLHISGPTRTERARLAPIIIELADSGDPAAKQIISDAIGELSALAIACSSRLSLTCPDIVLLGSLFSNPHFRSQTKDSILDTYPDARVCLPKLPPVSGALLKALRACGTKISDLTLENLGRSAVKLN